MIKFHELTNPKSCLNKAQPTEMLFVLLARDPAAPATIRAWADERVKLGKNQPDDRQIREALACASLMDKQREEWQRREDFGPNGDATTPGFFKRNGELPVPFTEEELATMRDELARLVLGESEVRLRKKAAMDAFKEELEELISSRRDIAHRIRRKSEDREIDCRVEFHSPTIGMKRLIRLDTGELLREEQMTDEECRKNFSRRMNLNKLFDKNDDPPPTSPEAAA